LIGYIKDCFKGSKMEITHILRNNCKQQIFYPNITIQALMVSNKGKTAGPGMGY
jgi:hypothetical protein